MLGDLEYRELRGNGEILLHGDQTWSKFGPHVAVSDGAEGCTYANILKAMEL